MDIGTRKCRWEIAPIIAVVCVMWLPAGLNAQLTGTARDYYGPAEQRALAWHSDAALLYCLGSGDEMHVAGETSLWSYFFESALDDSLYVVIVSLGLPLYYGEILDTIPILQPLPDSWIDSDQAVGVAESNGGSDFRQNTGSDLIIASAGRGLYLFDLQRPVWLFTYTDTTTYGTTIFVYIDAVTGDWIDTQGLGIGDEPTGSPDLPRAFSLEQNYPNPFNPSTTLRYTVPEGSVRDLSLEVYDVRGRRVRVLFSGSRAPGRYEVHWDGKDDHGIGVGAGLYLAKLRSERDIGIRKMTLVK